MDIITVFLLGYFVGQLVLLLANNK